VTAALQSDIDAEVEVMAQGRSHSTFRKQLGCSCPNDQEKKMAGGGSASITANSTKKGSYSMSNANKGLISLGGSKFRRKFDAASGYWHLPMVPGASEMAAFVAKCGLVLPFGLTNTPAMYG